MIQIFPLLSTQNTPVRGDRHIRIPSMQIVHSVDPIQGHRPRESLNPRGNRRLPNRKGQKRQGQMKGLKEHKKNRFGREGTRRGQVPHSLVLKSGGKENLIKVRHKGTHPLQFPIKKISIKRQSPRDSRKGVRDNLTNFSIFVAS